MIGGGNDRLFSILCARLAHPEWSADPRFLTNALRVANRAALEGLISARTATRPTAHWLAAFAGAGLPYAPINDVRDSLDDAHARARGMVQTVRHEACGELSLLGSPVKYSEARPGVRSAPPTLGQHTDEVLTGICGMSEAEVRELRSDGVVA